MLQYTHKATGSDAICLTAKESRKDKSNGCSGGMATGVMLLSILEMGVGMQLDRGGLVVVVGAKMHVFILHCLFVLITCL